MARIAQLSDQHLCVPGKRLYRQIDTAGAGQLTDWLRRHARVRTALLQPCAPRDLHCLCWPAAGMGHGTRRHAADRLAARQRSGAHMLSVDATPVHRYND